MRCELFASRDTVRLEEKINDFLENNSKIIVKDIKFTSTSAYDEDSYDCLYCLIIYENL